MSMNPAPGDDPRNLSPAQLSYAISLSRLMLVVGLVFLHYGNFPDSAVSPFVGIDTQGHRLATGINSVLVFFFYSAVPLLSMISGWLFFSFDAQAARAALNKRIRRRVVSLYMPLIVWNAAYLAALYVVFRINPNSSFFNHASRFSMKFASGSWLDYVNAVFGITTAPVAFQFWFVRDLFVTTLVSPVLWLMLRRIPWTGAAILCLVWIGGFNLGIFLRTDVPFFFYMGGLVHQKRLRLTIPLHITCLLIAAYIALDCLRALAPYAVAFHDDVIPDWLESATRAMRIVGVLACWGIMYRFAQTPWGRSLGRYGGLAFFLHSAHFPLLALVKMALAHVMAVDRDATMLLHDALSVAMTVSIGLGLGIALARVSPRLFALMNGGRYLEQLRDSGPTRPAG